MWISFFKNVSLSLMYHTDCSKQRGQRKSLSSPQVQVVTTCSSFTGPLKASSVLWPQETPRLPLRVPRALCPRCCQAPVCQALHMILPTCAKPCVAYKFHTHNVRSTLFTSVGRVLRPRKEGKGLAATPQVNPEGHVRPGSVPARGHPGGGAPSEDSRWTHLREQLLRPRAAAISPPEDISPLEAAPQRHHQAGNSTITGPEHQPDEEGMPGEGAERATRVTERARAGGAQSKPAGTSLLPRRPSRPRDKRT